MAPRKKPTKESKKLKEKVAPSPAPLSSSDSAVVNGVSRAEKVTIDNLIAQALTRHKAEVLIEQKEKFKEVAHLASIAEEYLSCFSLIGYSMQGEKVCVFNASSSKDEAALVDLLRSTFLEIANNRP